MKTFKKLFILVLALSFAFTLMACGDDDEKKPAHTHTACETCGKCTDATCTGLDAEKCPGHEAHTHTACPTCGKCTDATCTGTDAEKCPGHEAHTHTACPTCGKCTDATCTGTDAEKCPGHTVNTELENKADKVYIAGLDSVNGDLKLPKYVQGDTNYPITWSSSNTAVISIVEYDEGSEDREKNYLGRVELPAEETNVTLTATVTNGTDSTKREFTATVVADTYEAMTITEAKDPEGKVRAETTVRIEGTVAYTTNSGFFVTDGEDTIYIYLSNHKRTVGEKVIVRGVWTTYNNMTQLQTATASSLGMDPNFNVEDVAEAMTITQLAEAAGDKGTAAGDTTLMVKTTFVVTGNPKDDNYNPVKLFEPTDPTKFVGLTKYNTSSVLEEVAANGGKVYSAVLIRYCIHTAGTWSFVIIEDTMEEVTVDLTNDQKVAAAKVFVENALYGIVEKEGTVQLPSEVVGVEIEYTLDGTYSTIAVNGSVLTITPSATEAVKLNVNYKVDSTSIGSEVCEFNTKASTIKVNTVAETLTAAASLGEDENIEGTVYTFGVVKSIDTAYSSSYNNVTFTLTDGTKDISVFRMAGGETLAVGDIILVKGTVTNYKGTTIQYAAGSQPVTDYYNTVSQTLEAAASLGEDENIEGTVLTAGVVKSIDTAYSSSYNNITFTLTDGTKDISVFRMAGGETLAVGNVVLVEGTVTNYKGTTIQYAAGSKALFTYVLAGGTIEAPVEGIGTTEAPATVTAVREAEVGVNVVFSGTVCAVNENTEDEYYIVTDGTTNVLVSYYRVTGVTCPAVGNVVVVTGKTQLGAGGTVKSSFQVLMSAVTVSAQTSDVTAPAVTVDCSAEGFSIDEWAKGLTVDDYGKCYEFVDLVIANDVSHGVSNTSYTYFGTTEGSTTAPKIGLYHTAVELTKGQNYSIRAYFIGSNNGTFDIATKNTILRLSNATVVVE